METDLSARIKKAIDKSYTKEEARAMNPLALAYIGDSFFSNIVRRYLIGRGHQNVASLNKYSTLYVKASSQATIIHSLLDQLNDEEVRIVKRGRNTYSRPPKNANCHDYRYASGFEALLGYLYLIGAHDRLDWLCLQAILIINKEESGH